MSQAGGGSGMDFAQTTPASEGQIGVADYGVKIYNMFISGSTTKGDWLHGMAFPGGILSIGDGDLGDPLVGPVMTVNVNNGHTGCPPVASLTFSARTNTRKLSGKPAFDTTLNGSIV